jgi:hypothetical protein
MMRSRSCALFAALIVTVCGCSPGKGPFLQVQFCLADEREIADLANMMQLIARSEGMKFGDRSKEATEELARINKSIQEPAFNGEIIIMRVYGRDGMGMSATNLAPVTDQITVGFSEGSDPSKARRFADAVIDRLEERWEIVPVPANHGAIPLYACIEKSKAAEIH